ncbi:MAG: MFS transporter [Microbacteriaceae bacterium]|nr:MFS transporter [Microbacteriaceae bacterium]MCL2793738.1 MFS transporter [Microbacteriaceae bacterium]
MAPTSHAPALTRPLTLILAITCGVLVANLYYAQAAIGPISRDLGLSGGAQGLVVTLIQFGYALGLLLIASLADLVENRRLVLITVAITVLGLVGVTFAPSAGVFLVASLAVGVCTVGAQVLIPLATHLAPIERRGRVIGDLMGGLLGGIMLSRPWANFVTGLLGWRWVFGIAALLALALLVVLWFTLPRRVPEHAGIHYGTLLTTTFGYLASSRTLQRRSLYQALVFAAFNFFWTCVPLMLHGAFHFTQFQIALFALAGAGGALAAPFAGRLADRGFANVTSGVAFAVIAVMFWLSGVSVAARLLVPLVIAAVLIDAATQSNQVSGQRIVYGIAPEARGRVNSAYIFTFFLGGALGSLLAPIVYEHWGWTGVAAVGAAIVAFALAVFVTERVDAKQRREASAAA